MELIVTKNYPTYTISTTTKNGEKHDRYALNVKTGEYFSLDGRSQSINTFGAKIENEHLFYVVLAYHEMYLHGGIKKKNYKSFDLWANAYPSEITRLYARLGLDENVDSFFEKLGNKVTSDRAEILCKFANGEIHYLSHAEAMLSFLNYGSDANRLAFMEKCTNQCSFELNYFTQYYPCLFEYAYKVFCRGNLFEVPTNRQTFYFFAKWVNYLYHLCDWAAEDGLKRSEILEMAESINQKLDPLKGMSDFEALIAAGAVGRRQKILTDKVQRFISANLADKENELFTFRFLTTSQEYTQAGKDWDNCLGGWGMSNSIKYNHVVAEVTPNFGINRSPFVAGMYFSPENNKFTRYSYVVYEHNNNIPNDIKKALTEYLKD